MPTDTLAFVPARSGSRGLPGKNLRPFLGRPLLEWSLEVAEKCDSVIRSVLTSDSDLYLRHTDAFSKAVGLKRPAELAENDTPMSAVTSHVAKSQHDITPEYILLLDPTSPFRNPSEIENALWLLRERSEFAGAVSISQPDFNMRWVGVQKDPDDAITRAFAGGSQYASRQQVPPLWRMNGTFYIWRTEFARQISDPWLEQGLHLGIETPEERAFSIDTLREFEIAETLVRMGLIDWEIAPNAL